MGGIKKKKRGELNWKTPIYQLARSLLRNATQRNATTKKKKRIMPEGQYLIIFHPTAQRRGKFLFFYFSLALSFIFFHFLLEEEEEEEEEEQHFSSFQRSFSHCQIYLKNTRQRSRPLFIFFFFFFFFFFDGNLFQRQRRRCKWRRRWRRRRCTDQWETQSNQ